MAAVFAQEFGQYDGVEGDLYDGYAAASIAAAVGDVATMMDQLGLELLELDALAAIACYGMVKGSVSRLSGGEDGRFIVETDAGHEYEWNRDGGACLKSRADALGVIADWQMLITKRWPDAPVDECFGALCAAGARWDLPACPRARNHGVWSRCEYLDAVNATCGLPWRGA
ncbi:hypothetical protein GQ54DRAFT_299393, partial [Martensiomyces pterosporus]